MDGTQRSTEPADAVVKEITAGGGRALADYSDVSTSVGAQQLIDNTIKATGRIDIVINNAGILRDAKVPKLSQADWTQVVDVNLSGAFFVAQCAWPHLAERRYGRIVNTSSAAGLFGNTGHVNYSAAKMGLLGLTQSLALEGAELGIAANVIVPVGISRMFRLADKAGIRNETISAAVGWLAHEECTANGQVFWVRRERLAQAVIGITHGYHDPEMSIESIFENSQLITDMSNLNFPGLGGRG
jgi:NAD(P)-dependent dehydrogenase (short-subunit alcohol dehydrogenase family)